MDTSTPPPRGGLRSELSLVDAAAFSVGLIGPVGAIGLLGTGAAVIIGQAVTLSFVFAAVGIALVAYCFIKLSRHISHSGSVYALVGVTLGPRAGFVAGWSLMGAYIAIGCGSTIEMGLFGGKFLSDAGILTTQQWWWIALIGLIGVAAFAYAEIRIITRALLTSEVIGAVMVTILSVVILITVIFSHGPKGQSFNLNFLSLPSGSGIGTIAKSAVYGFLAFAGFEGAAALGEETTSPRTQIPRAIKTAVVVVGAFFLLTAAAQSLGYGANAAGAKAYANGFPFSDLSRGYIGRWYAAILDLMGTISLFAISLGEAAAASRIMYAQTRDATGTERGLARLGKRGQPVVALSVVLVIFLCALIGQQLNGSSVINATFYPLQIGTVLILVAYVLATVGAVYYLFFRGTPLAPRWQIVVPVLGGAFVCYTIYRNVFVGQTGAYSRFPYVEGIYLLIGLIVVLVAPGLSSRVRSGLASSDTSPRVDRAVAEPVP
ncbi:APC family permease [Conexibacter sp. DBS9H8]|uniref:APC family permease n=1 Tax=Conexibacter sp. DBS9H8 TaxID=2937801 RepID=UPI0020108794|nr:APC family permease [Conexibacter sp. DBS9H8]